MNGNTLKYMVIAGLLAIIGTIDSRADATSLMLVAQIARDRLSDKARARVDELASQLQKNGVPYNAVNLACWADDIKARDSTSPFHTWFRPWHYINIGCSPTDPDVLAHPPVLTATSGNIVLALTHCVDLIKNKQTDAMVPSEAVAVALVMHFVGDIHQPLHCTSRYQPGNPQNNDAGGNAVTVINLVQTPWPNLHTFWDEAHRRYYENGEVKAYPQISKADAPGSADLKLWLARLQADAPIDSSLRFDAAKWAREAHELGCRQGYGTLGEPYDSKNIKLQEQYVTEATCLMHRQIVLAGYRLAALLNELYGR